MSGNLPPGCTQQMCDEAQPGYWDDPEPEVPEPRYICADCEYFDRGDCLNSLSPRFQTAASGTCRKFYPDSTRWPNEEPSMTNPTTVFDAKGELLVG